MYQLFLFLWKFLGLGVFLTLGLRVFELFLKEEEEILHLRIVKNMVVPEPTQAPSQYRQSRSKNSTDRNLVSKFMDTEGINDWAIRRLAMALRKTLRLYQMSPGQADLWLDLAIDDYFDFDPDDDKRPYFNMAVTHGVTSALKSRDFENFSPVTPEQMTYLGSTGIIEQLWIDPQILQKEIADVLCREVSFCRQHKIQWWYANPQKLRSWDLKHILKSAKRRYPGVFNFKRR